MWPWEHLALGYLMFSLPVRLGLGRRPHDAEVLAVIGGTQFPDLIDKPLAWTFHVLPSGVSLAHSLVFAVSVTALLVGLASRFEVTGVGVAFGVGYASHLLGDAAYPYLTGRDLAPTFLLWPLYSRDVAVDGFYPRVLDLGTAFVVFLQTPRGQLYLGFELLLLGGSVALWLVDGRPGLSWFKWSTDRAGSDR